MSCGTSKHDRVKFVLPKTPHAFIKISDKTFISEPALDLSAHTLSEKQLTDLRAAKLTQEAWLRVFQAPTTVKPEDEDASDNDAFDEDHEVSEVKETEIGKIEDKKKIRIALPGLLSPKHSDSNVGIFSIVPKLSFDSVDSDKTAGSQDVKDLGADEEGVPIKLRSLESKIRAIKTAWPKPFLDIEASYMSMVNDIKRLGEKAMDLATAIGEDNNGKFPSLWKAVSSLSTSCEGIHANQRVFQTDLSAGLADIDRAKVDIRYLNDGHGVLEERLEAIETTINLFSGRFAKMRPVVEHWMNNKRNPTARGSGDDTSNLEVRIKRLEESAKESEWNFAENTNFDLLRDQINAMEAVIKDQGAIIHRLENRVVGTGVQMGDFVFQSYEDLHLWTKKHIPGGRFGLIVDAHSFLEFFTLAGHIDTELVAAAEHNAEKAGYATFYEMKVGASFSNMFPLIFGKPSSTGIDVTTGLPGVSSGDKWIHPTTGVHAQVMRKMNDISYQFDTNIRQVYRDYPEARKLATDCVTSAKRFIIDFFTFVSTEYQLWQQRGFSKKDAWDIVCQIIRRIFEDLETSRISARHSRDKNNMDATTTSIIMATLRCHDVQQKYVMHSFSEHPAVSSVITRHLAANFIKPESTPDSKLSEIEKKVRGLSTKVDQLDSRILKVEKNGK